MKALWIDTETGGLDPECHALLQVAGILVVDGAEKERFNLKMKPARGKTMDAKAMAVNGITKEMVETFMDSETAHKEFTSIISRHWTNGGKFSIFGYNVAFDESFLREWFNCHRYGQDFSRMFYWPAIDVASIAAYHLRNRRHELPNFKLGTVARFKGVEFQEGGLHDALVDIDVTKKLFEAMGGKVD